MNKRSANSETDVDNVAAACPIDCPRRRALMWLVVVAQFLIATTICLGTGNPFAHPGTLTMFAAATALGIWAILAIGAKTFHIAPMVRRSGQLTTGGPYRWIRHPMYSALLLFCLSFVLASPSVWSVALWLSLVAILAIKIHYEERELRHRYHEYSQYAQHTKRIIPFVL